MKHPSHDGQDKFDSCLTMVYQLPRHHWV